MTSMAWDKGCAGIKYEKEDIHGGWNGHPRYQTCSGFRPGNPEAKYGMYSDSELAVMLIFLF